MRKVELIAHRVGQLPGGLQPAALHDVDDLLARQREGAEASEWARFSAEQLLAHYAPEDSIYDAD